MASPTDDDLDGVSEGRKYPDGTVVRVFCMRTDRDAYSSGWAYTLHYGATEPDPPRTLADGTIRRYLENRRFSTTRRNGCRFETTTHMRIRKDTNCTLHQTPAQTASGSLGWSDSGNGFGAKSRNPSLNSSEAITPR
jgi:hypothetical protein